MTLTVKKIEKNKTFNQWQRGSVTSETKCYPNGFCFGYEKTCCCKQLMTLSWVEEILRLQFQTIFWIFWNWVGIFKIKFWQMTEDREVLREVWQGRIPASFAVTPEEVTTSLNPENFYLMLPRLSYFALCTEKVIAWIIFSAFLNELYFLDTKILLEVCKRGSNK